MRELGMFEGPFVRGALNDGWKEAYAGADRDAVGAESKQEWPTARRRQRRTAGNNLGSQSRYG